MPPASQVVVSRTAPDEMKSALPLVVSEVIVRFPSIVAAVYCDGSNQLPSARVVESLLTLLYSPSTVKVSVSLASYCATSVAPSRVRTSRALPTSWLRGA